MNGAMSLPYAACFFQTVLEKYRSPFSVSSVSNKSANFGKHSMLTLLIGAIALSTAQPPSFHEANNPLYKELLDPGLEVGPNVKAKFLAPSMADGLDAAKQKAVITELIGNDYSYAEFTRKSNVAPQILKLRNVEPTDPKAPARGVDVWYVAYGDLKALDDEKFLDRLLVANRGEGKATGITRADLKKRNIELVDPKHEGFGLIEFDFLEKVRLKATGRAFWSRTEESAVIAAQIDPRFTGDKEFPNQWQSLSKQSGTQKVGTAEPWSGAAIYLKVTKLSQPVGALFIEQHIIFAEPTGWFDGENLLRSKLPLVVQKQVRNIRLEWSKASEK
jgi:hypothetical protein